MRTVGANRELTHVLKKLGFSEYRWKFSSAIYFKHTLRSRKKLSILNGQIEIIDGNYVHDTRRRLNVDDLSFIFLFFTLKKKDLVELLIDNRFNISKSKVILDKLKREVYYLKRNLKKFPRQEKINRLISEYVGIRKTLTKEIN